MNDFATFEKQLDRFVKNAERAVEEVVKGVAEVTRDRVAAKSPVRTGRFRASWNAQANFPDFSTKGEDYFDPGGAVAAGNVNLEGFQIGGEIYVSNSVHYGFELNMGSSRQAPAGFVETTAVEVELAMPGIVAEARRRVG